MKDFTPISKQGREAQQADNIFYRQGSYKCLFHTYLILQKHY